MQNKPNFQNAQVNLSIFSTKAYENKHNWTLGENKPNSNPTCSELVEPISNVMPVFLRKSAWGRLTAESLGLLITKGIAKSPSFLACIKAGQTI